MTGYSCPLENPAWSPEEKPQPSKLARLELAFWVFFVNFLVIGYYTTGKSFAYLGVPQARIFIGEIFLFGFIAAWPTGFLNTWITSMVKRHPLTLFGWAHLLFLGYGLFEMLRGLENGYAFGTAVLNLVFNIYPIYVFIGFWFARKVPGILERMIPIIALFNGVYGLAFIAFLNTRADIELPGANVSVFGQPGGSMIALLGLIIVSKRSSYHSLLMLLNALVLLGTQVRGDWLGFLLGLVLWGALTGNLGTVFRGGAFLSTILLVGLITDVRLPGVAGRGGETSAREMVGRALAGIDKEAAREFSKDVDAYAGTLQWRKNWWKEIWITIHSDTEKTFLGLGYGFPLASLVTYIGQEKVATRTPHSIFYYALGYSGWIGVLLFVSLQLSLAWTMWVTYRKTKASIGIAIFFATLTTAMAGNCLETPFGAIPFYTVIGMCVARQGQMSDEEAEADEQYEADAPRYQPAFPNTFGTPLRPLVKPETDELHPNIHVLRRKE